MIPAVTAADNTVSQNTTKPVKNRPLVTGVKQYADSFVRNTVESAPIMLAFTGGWALFDKFAMKTTFKKAVSHNFKNFFVPVTLVSSAVLAGIETVKYSKQKNNDAK